MKKFVTVAFAAILGTSCLCGNTLLSKEATYCEDGIMPLTATDVRVYYEDRTINEFRMVLEHPDYTVSPYLADCACIAGANVIGFYDRYDENLIPNHTAGTVFQGHYIYNMEDSTITDLVKQLYADMGTDSHGTTVAEFKSGMTKFCKRKGKSITFSSCMVGGEFDYSFAKLYMESNWPVVLFCDGYNVSDTYTYDGYDKISYYESTANHVMVGFGYKETTYQLTSSSQAVYRYIKVASDTASKPNGYYNIDYNTHINDAYAIYIN